MSPLEMPMPQLNLSVLAPVLIVLGAACVGILIEAFASRHARHFAQVVVTLTAIVSALVVELVRWNGAKLKIAGGTSVAVDGPTYFIWMLILVFGGMSVMVFAERRLHNGATAFTASGASVPGSQAERDSIVARSEHSEVFPLALFSMAGMMLFTAANDLLMLFVALEVMSLPLYLLSGLARRRRLLSQEAAMKYFLLGALSSAIMLYGIALTYGYTGMVSYDGIAAVLAAPTHKFSMILAGMAMIVIGVLFKIGAVPFHNWTPDVYTGAPTPVTGFMAACTKIAAVGALLRVLYVAFGSLVWSWQPVIAVIALLTMLVGSVVAVVQTDIKRLLAYSSISHAGFILTAVCGASVFGNGIGPGSVTSVGAIMFYLAAYGFATIGAFAVVTLVRAKGGEQTTIAGWAGIGRRYPLVGVTFAFFLLSFAGIPLTGGFIGKWAVFVAAWQGGYWWLVIVAVLMSIVTAFFYLKVIMVMFFTAPGEAEEPAELGKASVLTWIPIIVGGLATLVLGIVPGPLLDLANQASTFLR